MSIEGSGASRGGGEGLHNEDVFLVEDGLGLYLICDGASESEAGEVAARIASEAVAASVRQSEDELDANNARVARFIVEKAINKALRALADAERTDPELARLATTITLLLAHRGLGIIGHRGDSRAYLVRRSRTRQLTVDHELSESVESTKDPDGDFDVFAVELQPGDTVVLCSDGAEAVVEDPAISRVAADLSPRLLASRIVSAAKSIDASLDATAVVVRVRRERDAGWLELSEPPQRTAFGHTLERA